ncbi:MAG: FMN-binding negative transcriptional regulator [Actinomycetota bacterium]|nr:FMN-binding negative transcriptional regulator [Actinomycetota bacterium]
MYLQRHFEAGEELLQEMLANLGALDLVTASESGLDATVMPMIYRPGERSSSLRGHMARANRQWRGADGGPALAIARGPGAYVSPSYYPSKERDPRVVPTWNYLVLHFHGILHVHDDQDWTRENVEELTRLHEGTVGRTWRVEDAPADYVAQMLKGVVGVEMVVERVEAKAKMSQNRPLEDASNVARELDAAGKLQAAAVLRAVNSRRGAD